MNQNDTPSNEQPYKVVVGIDFATAGEGALARALSMANVHPFAEVHAVTVLDPGPVLRGHEVRPDAATALQDLASKSVADLAGRGEPVRVRRVITHLLVGSPARVIVELAAHLNADLIVVGTHDRHGASATRSVISVHTRIHRLIMSPNRSGRRGAFGGISHEAAGPS